MTVPWSNTFEERLRRHLPDLPDADPLTPETVLPTLGLDSLGMVALVGELEEHYGFLLPEESLVPRNFRTPLDVWSVIAGVLGARHHGDDGRAVV